MKLVSLASACFALLSSPAIADGDVALGEKQFQRCVVCHLATSLSHRNGPTLRAVVGRPVASVEGFAYSDAMKAFGATGAIWNDVTLSEFLKNPTEFLKGTKMSGVPPLRRDTERADLIEYLKTF